MASNTPMVCRWATLYLILEGVGAAAWWLMLLVKPETRKVFFALGTPDAALFAFALPDWVFYIGGALLTASGIARRRRWAWPLLGIHTGAVAYAGLYGFSLVFLRAALFDMASSSQSVPVT